MRGRERPSRARGSWSPASPNRHENPSSDSSYVDMEEEKLPMKVEVKHLESRYNADNYVELYEAGSTPPNKNKTDKYRNYVMCSTRFFNREGFPTSRQIDIKSPLLKTALKEIIGDYPGISFRTINVTLTVPFHVLWHYFDELKTLHGEEMKQKSELGEHLTVLVDYLDNEFMDVNKEYNNLVPEGLISFEILWTLFKPGDLIFTNLFSQPRVLRLKKYSEGHDLCGVFASLSSVFVDYDGKRFGENTAGLRIPLFDGAIKIADLPALPFDLHPKKEEIREKLIRRGEKYVSLQGINCREYNGISVAIENHQLTKVHVSGRVMIDADTHALFNADEAKNLKPLSHPQKKKLEAVDESDDESPDRGCWDYDNRRNQGDNNGQDFEEVDNQEKRIYTLTDDECLLCNSLVWGYALDQKRWVQFFVDKLMPVQWNPSSFDKLVLPDAQKDLVRALVQAHTNPDAPASFDDFIANKGKGLISVLHGPPGVGKTFTAESVAEFAKRPLYTISSGDLGTSPHELEAALAKTLRMCTIWNAVLLLDEADVYLEERSLHDIKRNALVSIFLRLLEYYQGILFLTTNRVKTFDEAFQSRIHIAIRYRDLDQPAREQVWRNFVEKIESGGVITDIQHGDYEFLRDLELNGRQIKNAARTGLSLAENKGERLTLTHLKTVLGVVEAFERDFKAGKALKE